MQEINTADPSTLIPARRGDLEKLFGSGRVGAIPFDGHGRGTVLLGAGRPCLPGDQQACATPWPGAGRW